MLMAMAIINFALAMAYSAPQIDSSNLKINYPNDRSFLMAPLPKNFGFHMPNPVDFSSFTQGWCLNYNIKSKSEINFFIGLIVLVYRQGLLIPVLLLVDQMFNALPSPFRLRRTCSPES